MTITHQVQEALFQLDQDSLDIRLIRLPPNAPPVKGQSRRPGTPWTVDEHNRFLHALERFPSGPWKKIASHVGTRSTRQTMTHAQKYREKIARRRRGSTAMTSFPTSTTEFTPPERTPLPPPADSEWFDVDLFDELMLGEDRSSAGHEDDDALIDQLMLLLSDYEPLELTDDNASCLTESDLSSLWA